MEKKLIDPSTQLLLTSATIPHGLNSILSNLLGESSRLKTINTNKINKIMFHVPQKFIRTNGVQRQELLLDILRKELNHASKKRTIMIFAHRIITAAYVHKFLIENNIPNDLLIKTISNTQRENVVSRFLNGDVRILCCTDIASRGWDTLNVNHVINYEMPKFISDYVHRIGRVGRLNKGARSNDGKVTNFITNRYEVDLVWNIEKSVRLNCELDNVNANVKKFYKNMYAEEFEQNSYAINREKLDLFKINKESKGDNCSDENDSNTFSKDYKQTFKN
jgi:ATP-dependent RNA helicase DDX28